MILLSPKVIFFGLSGCGTIGLLACFLAEPVILSSPISKEGRALYNNLKSEYEKTCGKNIWGKKEGSSITKETKNEKKYNLEEWAHCYASVASKFMSSKS